MGSTVSYAIAVHKVYSSLSSRFRLICSLMSSLATSQLDFHHIKVNFIKSEVVQPLVTTCPCDNKNNFSLY